MSQSAPSQHSLDLERADFSDAGSASCASCSVALSGFYYTQGERTLCERCFLEVRDAGPPGNAVTRASGALALGGVAAVLAGGLWMGVTQLTGYEIGLIALVVGFGVGVAVRIGSGGVGGIGYQLLAVFLTYSAIVMTYVPMIVDEFQANEEIQAQLQTAATGAEAAATPDGEAPLPMDAAALTFSLYLLAVPLAYAAPFLAGLENIIGLLIIGFALYEAWKLNKRVPEELAGPFQLGTGGAPVG